MSAAHDVEALLARINSKMGAPGRLRSEGDASRLLTLSWPGLNDVLPDGGLPRGVVELASPRALGGATSVALAAVRAGQLRGDKAWCAWIDPEGTLHAPGVVSAGVDLGRLLVVHSPRAKVWNVAVKVVKAGAFEVIVVDYDAVPGASPELGARNEGAAGARTGTRAGKRSSSAVPAPEVLVRKLALAAEPSGATVMLLTDSARPRTAPWPVALRLELSRPSRHELTVRVAKDRCGRSGLVKTVPFHPVAALPCAGVAGR
jgi:recombination protein RecA